MGYTKVLGWISPKNVLTGILIPNANWRFCLMPVTSVALQKFILGYGIFVQHFKQLGNDALLPTSDLCPTALVPLKDGKSDGIVTTPKIF